MANIVHGIQNDTEKVGPMGAITVGRALLAGKSIQPQRNDYARLLPKPQLLQRELVFLRIFREDFSH